MTLILSGTDGLSDVDGTAATPAIRGTDANTGIFFGTDIIGFSEGGVEAVRIDSAGNVGIGTSSPTTALTLGTSHTATVQNGGSNSAPAYAITSGALGINGITAPAANNLAFVTGSGERARFNSTGALVFAGGTTTADGIGITFPATQSASTNANTLDDYEEGTWTPTGNGVTYTSNTGKYTKIGDFVFCAYVLTFPSTASASGAQIQGLPFAVGSQPRGTATVSETNSGVNPIMMALSGTTAFIRDADNNDRANSAFSLDFLNGMIIYRV